jgi:hypothetical protein
VRFVSDGPIGKFNRAQRAFFNYLEVLPGLLGSVFCAGAVFPLPTFALVVGTFIGRLWYTFGYTAAPESRGPGFMISTLLPQIVDGLTLLSGLKLVCGL